MKPLEKFRKEQLGAARVLYDFRHFLHAKLHNKNRINRINRAVHHFISLKQTPLFVFLHSFNLSHCVFVSFFKAERKKYEKETEKYYSSLEKLLNMSAKKKEPQLQEVPSRLQSTQIGKWSKVKREGKRKKEGTNSLFKKLGKIQHGGGGFVSSVMVMGS
jgi:hypothetical protein